MTESPRQAAFLLLLKLESRKSRIAPSLDLLFAKKSFEERDRAFVSELVYGVTRWRRGIDVIIQNCSTTPIAKIAPSTLNLLRLGLYQVFEMGGVPIHAAVNETVNMAKKDVKARHFVKFINAVLRGAIRKTDADKFRRPICEVVASFQKKEDPDHLRLAERYSFPDWMAQRWVKKHGVTAAEKIMEASDKKAPVFFRLNSLKAGPDELESKLKSAGVEAERVGWVENCYRLTSGKITPGMDIFKNGLIQPQDASSIIAASLLGARPGDIVADICCGKGIKSGAIAQDMSNRGFIFCVDNSILRLEDMKQNMERLGVGVCRPVLADAATALPTVASFGRIFIDAPCTGSGGFRRKPEGKWNKEPALVAQMAAIQRNVLRTAAERLAPGGVLVYSICSIEPAEGAEQVERLLKERGDIKRDDIRKTNPQTESFIDDSGDLYILPGDGDMDGFYAARLRKTG